jgi:hypothetical protein
MVSEHTATVGAALGLKSMGWVVTDIGTSASARIGMNDPIPATNQYMSCLLLDPGTGNDDGFNMQLDPVNATDADVASSPQQRHNFQHLWIPEDAALPAGEALDNSVWVFACRLGFFGETTDWGGKAFVGFAAAGDTSIMTAATGIITVAGDPLLGFHIPEDGSIDGFSKRIAAAASVDGTNFLEMAAAGAVDGSTTAAAATWFDVALRMTVTDMSDNAANGATEFFIRRVPRITGTPGTSGGNLPGEGDAWTRAGVLNNATMNHDVAMVPTIEVLNGPAGREAKVLMDWWAFGRSRFSR